MGNVGYPFGLRSGSFGARPLSFLDFRFACPDRRPRGLDTMGHTFPRKRLGGRRAPRRVRAMPTISPPSGSIQTSSERTSEADATQHPLSHAAEPTSS